MKFPFTNGMIYPNGWTSFMLCTFGQAGSYNIHGQWQRHHFLDSRRHGAGSIAGLGWKYWPAVFLGAISAGLMVNDPLGVSVFLAAGNTLETLFAFWLFRRLLGEVELKQPRDFLRLAYVAMSSSMVSALIGPFSLLVAGYLTWQTIVNNIFHWWQADTLGILVGTPLF